MKADHSQHPRFPDALRLELAAEEPDTVQELEEVWALLEAARPSSTPATATADAAWARLSQNIFVEETAPVRTLHTARPPVRHARSRTAVWAGVAMAACIALAGLYLLTPARYSAPSGQTLAVNLPDGSRVELNSGSEISFDRGLGASWFGQDTARRVYLEGEAFFSVTTDGRPFQVETFNAVVQVLGTEFNVKSWPTSPTADTRVAVKEGHVRVSPGEVDLLANQAVRVRQGSAPERLEDDVNLVLNWRDRGFSILGEPLQAAFLQMERQYAVEIDVRASIDPQVQVVYYRNDPNVETLLGDLCAAHGLQFRKTLRGFEVYR